MTKKGDRRRARHLKKRQTLWPDLGEEMFWNWKKKDVYGFGTIPRTMPYFFKIMDELAPGKRISGTYFALWCRLWDETGLLKVVNPIELAWESGFSGQRALSTWRSRMKILEDLGFIQSKPLGDEKYGFIVLLNPYLVVKNHYGSGLYSNQGWYNALAERAEKIRATDLEEEEEEEE